MNLIPPSHSKLLVCSLEEAKVSARKIVADMILKGEKSEHWQFEIATSTGTIARIVPFKIAMDLTRLN